MRVSERASEGMSAKSECESVKSESDSFENVGCVNKRGDVRVRERLRM